MHISHPPTLDAQHCIIRVEPPPSSITKVTHVPVHVRTYKLPAPKAAILPKVTQALTELGINHTRLVMPTRENCGRLESLIEASAALIDTKKTVDRVEQDIRVLRVRLGRQSDGPEEDGKEGTPMEVDGGAGVDGEGELKDGGRAQSIVSTRSGRGRKQVCHCSEISSMLSNFSLSADRCPYHPLILQHPPELGRDRNEVDIVHIMFDTDL
jgi:DNA methyltransferase 1-associated protein 1